MSFIYDIGVDRFRSPGFSDVGFAFGFEFGFGAAKISIPKVGGTTLSLSTGSVQRRQWRGSHL